MYQSDWEESSDEEDDDDEEEKPKATGAAVPAPSKKKGSLKAKLAAKEAEKAAKTAAGEDSDDVYDSDDVLDPREKARRDKEKELNADLNNAADLLGAAALGGMCWTLLDNRDYIDHLCTIRYQRQRVRQASLGKSSNEGRVRSFLHPNRGIHHSTSPE